MAKDQVSPVSLKPENSFKRLPSFKSPRDLKLSQFTNPLGESRTKKVFVPNLNVQRRKQAEDGERKSRQSEREERTERGRGRGGQTERGRGRGRRQFIQSAGVFSEGLAPQLKSRSARGSFSAGGDSSGSPALVKPKLKLNELIKADKEEEALIMQELMRDDFLDDPNLQPDLDVCPIELPLTKLEDLKIESVKKEIVEKEPPGVPAANGIRIKKEPGSREAEAELHREAEEMPVSALGLGRPSLTQFLSHPSDTNFIFFQIPNSIPRLKVPESVVKPASKGKRGQGKERAQEGPSSEDSEERRTLRNLPGGRIGTLQMLKSGRARLLLGDVKLQVEPGTQVAFKQELLSVDVSKEDKSGKLIHMGNLTTRMLVTPDWESLLLPSVSS